MQVALNSEGRVAKFNNSRSELVIRCVYCGDSIKNENHAHFFIGNKAPFPFFCHRCNTKGVLDSDTLRDIQIPDSSLVNKIARVSRTALRNLGLGLNDTNSLLGKRKRLAPLVYDEDSPKYQQCKAYLEKRIGIPFTKEMMEDCKVVVRFYRLIKDNDLKGISIDEKK